MPDRITIPRVSFADHARAAADRLGVSPDDAGRIAAEATRLDPLHRIQTAFDQVVRHAEDRESGRPFDYPVRWPEHVAQTIDHCNRLAAILHVASEAATSMIGEAQKNLSNFEDAMTKRKDDDEAPKLTTTGEPHPLQQGGYDPDADPQLPGNISDVEAGKEGKTTRAQAEAIAAADAEGDEGEEPTPSDAATDDDADDTPHKRSARKPKK